MNKISPKRKRSPLLAVDGLIFEKGKVLMVRQAHYPFFGYWVLPGGHVEYGETVEEAIKREMKEELGIPVKIEKLIGVYSDPKRDPRGHTVSVAYLLKRGKGRIKLNKESSEFKFFSLLNLPGRIGFDHKKIIEDFQKLYLNKKGP
jgi:8-oxo-dGTP diphosphatase